MRWKETNACEVEDVRRLEDFTETMELEDQTKSDWSRYHQPPMEFDLSSELNSSYEKLEGESDAYCNFWMDVEPVRVKTCNGHSFAMEARMRLDHLKSGCNSPSPGCVTSRSLYRYNCEKDLWDSEESVLDSVEILDIEEGEHDEESWLYELPKKLVGVKESALGWCRHVLDNPSPEMEAARHALMNKLDQRSRHHIYRQPAVLHHASSARSTLSDRLDRSELSNSHNSMTTSYRLQDITDVHIMAQIQEASLRQDYISMPSTASSMRNTDSPTSAAKQSCQSPRLARLHQQVAQFKLLKRAQNRGASSPDRSSSPLRTSLRSLQAVRNSRSLESDDDGLPAEQLTHSPPGVPSSRMGSNGCSTPTSPTSGSSSTPPVMKKQSSLRAAAIKRLQRSQSLSPCRIPHPAKAYLSVTSRVFASPEKATTGAWAIHR